MFSSLHCTVCDFAEGFRFHRFHCRGYYPYGISRATSCAKEN